MEQPILTQVPPTGRWPSGSRLLQLRPMAKQPYGGATGHAHLGAVLDADFVPAGRNVGIVLDGMFIAVDIDQPHDPVAQDWMAQMVQLGTWQQATPREKAQPADRALNPHGHHWLVAVPPGYAGGNSEIVGAHGQHVGDVKARGYIVAPGSSITCIDGVEREYQMVNPRFPAAAPPWLLKYAASSHRQAPGAAPAGVAGERDAIPSGSHDDFLASLGAFLRTSHGLSEAGLRKALTAAHGLLDGIDTRRPYTEADFARIARSCVNLDAGVRDSGALMPSAWRSGRQVALVQPPVEYWIRGFVPKGRLIMVYGGKARGKSSFGSLLASDVTKAGGGFAPVLVEETFEDFLWRAVLAGADRDRIFAPVGASGIQLPRDAGALQQAIELSNVDVIWFDSIYSHFESNTGGLNMAERTRRCLTPLSEICHRTGKTIIAVFHENKMKEFLGSVEMVNVARTVLHVSRDDRGGPMYLNVAYTNLRKPDHQLTFGVNYQPAVDPETGEVQYERLDDGTLAPFEIGVPVALGREALIPPVPEDLLIEEQTPGRRTRRETNDGFAK